MNAPPDLSLFLGTTDALGERTDLLCADERERLQAMASPRRRAQFCAGRALLRLALGHLRAAPAQPWPFMLEDGRPVLSDPQAPQLSLSHSGNHVACAIGHAGRCGVDLQIDTGRSNRGIADTFFAPADVDWLQHQADATRAFRELWVLKEAWAKASGKALIHVLQHVRFAPADPTPRHWQAGTTPLSPALSLGWAVDRPCAPPALLAWRADGFAPMAATFTRWQRIDAPLATMPNGQVDP